MKGSTHRDNNVFISACFTVIAQICKLAPDQREQPIEMIPDYELDIEITDDDFNEEAEVDTSEETGNEEAGNEESGNSDDAAEEVVTRRRRRHQPAAVSNARGVEAIKQAFKIDPDPESGKVARPARKAAAKKAAKKPAKKAAAKKSRKK